MDRQAMTEALQTACQYGISDCLSMATKQLNEYPTEPDRDQKLTSYCYGIQEGDRSDWDMLWDSYKTETNANELYSIRYGLSCSKDAATLNEYLAITIEGNDIRVQDKHSVINQVSSTVYGRDIAWTFIMENWDWFYDM